MKNKNKVVVITGDSKGIGRYLTEYYLKKGFVVAGCSRLESGLNTKSRSYSHFRLDVSQEDQVVKTVRSIFHRFKGIDILINCAGIASLNHALLTPAETVDRIFAVNFKGTFLMSRECSKFMKINRCGRIVNISSVAVPLKIEGEAIYAASKSAVATFSEIFAKEVAPFNITCNCVGPTPIETDLIKNVPVEKIDRIINSLSLKRMGKFIDVANAIDFFVKDESGYVTGQTIYLGGV
ncbi:MAG: SDR family NAD(P)-dependent oxidoreductase [Candidatus Omnitrophica bacterium]|nr:SDR family NAD(P)-dependent oxidoreductase [Candidatus Omnitrophota bacterium]